MPNYEFVERGEDTLSIGHALSADHWKRGDRLRAGNRVLVVEAIERFAEHDLTRVTLREAKDDRLARGAPPTRLWPR
jgi:hypothetical protein